MLRGENWRSGFGGALNPQFYPASTTMDPRMVADLPRNREEEGSESLPTARQVKMSLEMEGLTEGREG